MSAGKAPVSGQEFADILKHVDVKSAQPQAAGEVSDAPANADLIADNGKSLPVDMPAGKPLPLLPAADWARLDQMSLEQTQAGELPVTAVTASLHSTIPVLVEDDLAQPSLVPAYQPAVLASLFGIDHAEHAQAHADFTLPLDRLPGQIQVQADVAVPRDLGNWRNNTLENWAPPGTVRMETPTVSGQSPAAILDRPGMPFVVGLQRGIPLDAAVNPVTTGQQPELSGHQPRLPAPAPPVQEVFNRTPASMGAGNGGDAHGLARGMALPSVQSLVRNPGTDGNGAGGQTLDKGEMALQMQLARGEAGSNTTDPWIKNSTKIDTAAVAGNPQPQLVRPLNLAVAMGNRPVSDQRLEALDKPGRVQGMRQVRPDGLLAPMGGEKSDVLGTLGSTSGPAQPLIVSAVPAPVEAGTLNASQADSTNHTVRQALGEQVQAQVRQALANQVQAMVNGGRLTVHLNPQQLGSIDLAFSEEQGELQLAIVAREGATRELLESTLPRLRQSLQEMGIVLKDIDLQPAGDEGAEHSQAESQRQPAPGQDVTGDDDIDQPENEMTSIYTKSERLLDAYV